ncbi:MAG: T9SS type A sorting domain-containing protein [Bacteroidia bacterium]|nr:T9SS type A sorting domain-containing protein [Bacteroidia bacterium]
MSAYRISSLILLLLILGFFSNSTASHDPMGLKLQVYPNPSSSGIFSVEVSSELNLEDLKIVVFNLIGERVYEAHIHHDAQQFNHLIDLSGEATGMYLLEISHQKSKQLRRISIN